LLSDDLKKLAGILDEICRVLLLKIGGRLVIGPPAHRLGRRERVADLIRHLPGPDEVVPKSTNDTGVSVGAFPFGQQGGPSDLENRVVPAVD
jgi:hypothetical protein